jgi:hypothetical protein
MVATTAMGTRKTGGAKLITCFLPHGKAMEVAERLHREKSIAAANFYSGRGRGTLEAVGDTGWVEIDILEIVIAAGVADEIFAHIYEIADIDRPHGGVIVQSHLNDATSYVLPEQSAAPFTPNSGS